MALVDNKITAFSKTIAALADKPSLGTTALLKQWFDSSPEELRVAHNNLIDFMAANYKFSSTGINVVDYNSSGSPQTTIGSISSGSNILTNVSALDFVNGQGIAVNHAGAACTLTTLAAPTVTPTGATGTTAYQYQIVALDANGGCTAAGTAGTTATGNATLSATNYNALSWTAVASASAYAIYGRISGTMNLLSIVSGTTFNDIGAASITPALALPTTPPATSLADTLVTSILSGAGSTSLTLAANATTTASSQTVSHDDTAQIQQGINATPIGGTLYLPGLQFRTSSVLTVTKEIFIYGPQAEIYCDHLGTGILVQNPSGTLGLGKVSQVKMDISITRSTISTSSTAIGIEIVDCFRGVFNISRLTNHGIGMKWTGLTSGMTYNQFRLGFFVDCYVGIKTATSGSGYVTENTVYGGNFTTGYSNNSSLAYAHIWIDNSSLKQQNDNKFFSCSFEGFHQHGVIIDSAKNNIFTACRFEMPQSGTLYYLKTISSSDCQSNVFNDCWGLTLGLKNGKILDGGRYTVIRGSDSDSTCSYQYTDGQIFLFVKSASAKPNSFNAGIKVVSVGTRTIVGVTASTSTVTLDLTGSDQFNITCVAGVDITSIVFSALPPVGTEVSIGFLQAASPGNAISGFPSLFLGSLQVAPVKRANGRDVYKCIMGTSLNEMYCIGHYGN